MNAPAVATAKVDLALYAPAGTRGVIVAPPPSMLCKPGAVVFVCAEGYVAASPDEISRCEGRSPYRSFEEAENARRRLRFSLLPQSAEDILEDLLDQLDGIGIPDWAGAEGLSLEAARAFIALGRAEELRAQRDHDVERRRIDWDDPEHPYAAWQHEVENGDTRIGFADWVMSRRDMEDAERELAVMQGADA